MANDKYLFVVSGAAGTGKDSVVKALREAHPEIEKTVSATTRAPRPGEQEGVDYYYRTREQFQQLIENDQVVEHNFYNGNYYGTLREEVDKRLAARKVVVLVIDVHGAANIRRMFPGATTVFLLPPSVEELERRLRGRGTETEDSIQERLATARQVWPSLRICSVSSPMAKNSTSGKAACSAAKRLMLGPTSGYARVRCFAPALAAISASAMVAHLKRSMPASICIWTTSAILWVLMWGHRRAAPPAMSIILRIFSRMIAG